MRDNHRSYPNRLSRPYRNPRRSLTSTPCSRSRWVNARRAAIHQRRVCILSARRLLDVRRVGRGECKRKFMRPHIPVRLCAFAGQVRVAAGADNHGLSWPTCCPAQNAQVSHPRRFTRQI